MCEEPAEVVDRQLHLPFPPSQVCSSVRRSASWKHSRQPPGQHIRRTGGPVGGGWLWGWSGAGGRRGGRPLTVPGAGPPPRSGGAPSQPCQHEEQWQVRQGGLLCRQLSCSVRGTDLRTVLGGAGWGRGGPGSGTGRGRRSGGTRFLLSSLLSRMLAQTCVLWVSCPLETVTYR